jgi:hypothetical protein
MRKVVGILIVILGVFLFFAEYSLGTPDRPEIEPVKRSQNAEPAIQSEAAPKISSDEPLFDFGQVKQGEKVEHLFRVQNTGTADLVIDRATGS